MPSLILLFFGKSTINLMSIYIIIYNEAVLYLCFSQSVDSLGQHNLIALESSISTLADLMLPTDALLLVKCT